MSKIAIHNRFLQHNDNANSSNFKLLDCRSNEYRDRKIAETFSIKEMNPNLNLQVESQNLLSFNYPDLAIRGA